MQRQQQQSLRDADRRYTCDGEIFWEADRLSASSLGHKRCPFHAPAEAALIPKPGFPARRAPDTSRLRSTYF